MVITTNLYESIRSGSSINLGPIHTFKLISKLFKILKGQFLRISTVTHCPVPETYFNFIIEVLSRPPSTMNNLKSSFCNKNS